MVNSMVEKSPNAVSVLTPRLQVRSSGIENLALSMPMPVRALTDIDQAVLIAVDQRPQEHAPDDAEDRGIRADPERQGQDDGDGQALDPGQRSERERSR